MTKPLASVYTGWVAVRLACDGYEFFLDSEIRPSPEWAKEVAGDSDRQVPRYAAENPVQRIIRLKMIPVEE